MNNGTEAAPLDQTIAAVLSGYLVALSPRATALYTVPTRRSMSR